MALVAKAGAAGSADPSPIGGAADPIKAAGQDRRAEEEDEPEGDRLSEQVEQLLMDIKTGKVNTTVYTFDEYMRYLDDIRGARPHHGHFCP